MAATAAATAASGRRTAGICMFYTRAGQIYVLIGRETVWGDDARVFIEGGDVCAATLEFSRIAEAATANFAPIQRTDTGFKTTIRTGGGRYGIPKGGMDGDPAPEITALRELYEETGTLLEPELLVHRHDSVIDYATGPSTTTIFFVHMSEESALQIIANYKTYLEQIHYGELVELDFYNVRDLRGFNLNQVSVSALRELGRMAAVAPVVSEAYAAPCKSMWGHIEHPGVCALTDLMVNVHFIKSLDRICDAYHNITELVGRLGLDATISELLGRLTPREHALVRRLTRYVAQSAGDPGIGVAIIAVLDRMAAATAATATTNNTNGGKRKSRTNRTKKRKHNRKRQTRNQKKRVL